MDQTAIPCVVMRGGTSRGLYFRPQHLPTDIATRDRVLLAAMGSPDARQTDGLGGAHPLTSKVAIVGPSSRDDADVDYLFLQVGVGEADVRDDQNCGNLLAGVGPFAIEQGLVAAKDGMTEVRIHMVNSGSLSVAHVMTPGGVVTYAGDARIDGVPGSAAPVVLDFDNIAGSICGALLPTGRPVDDVDGIALTCVDNGMPVVIMRAADFGLTGQETPAALEADEALGKRIEAIRVAVGERMKLGDVRDKSVPKMCLAAAPGNGGSIATRMFIPQRVHESVGVLAATSVAAACLVPGSIAQAISGKTPRPGAQRIGVEHPTGCLTVEIEMRGDGGGASIERSALLRTARKLMQGDVFVPAEVWGGPGAST